MEPGIKGRRIRCLHQVGFPGRCGIYLPWHYPRDGPGIVRYGRGEIAGANFNAQGFELIGKVWHGIRRLETSSLTLVDEGSTFGYTDRMIPKIRAIALCVFLHEGKLLVSDGYDAIKQQSFGRPLGGTIEFGESSHNTIVREIREEVGAEITNLRYLGILENIFTYNGEIGHEIVLMYRGDFVDPAYYQRSPIDGNENGHPLRAIWVPLADFARGLMPLYPDGLFELIQKEINS